VRDRDGNPLGTIIDRHDGTPAGIIAAARIASEQMFLDYPQASNIQSFIGATDADGVLRWSISPNFRHLAESGTDEAEYIWTGEMPNSIQRKKPAAENF
jgi:hypothetical protein